MPKKPSAPRFIHEILPDGRHRIVVQRGEGFGVMQEQSPWAAKHELAELGRYRANTFLSNLPYGIFMLGKMSHDVLIG